MYRGGKTTICDSVGNPLVENNTTKGLPISFADDHHIDSFGRLRVSSPTNVFDSQFTYDLQPLLYEQVVSGTGAAIAHNSTNRQAVMTFASTPTGGSAFMQSYQCFRYQPGKSQFIHMSFDFDGGVANCLKFAGYSDGVNGIELQHNGTTAQWVIYSGTGLGNQTVTQANWNLDKLDGTGTSGITIDWAAANILVIDMQALYTGRVRVGFDINGTIVYCHQFLNSNISQFPYIQSANLPLRCGMTCTGTVSTTMKFTCSSIVSEGGVDNIIGYEFAQEGTGTAGNGVPAHILSIRPKTLFNGIVNRATVYFVEIDLIVTGANSVKWDLVIGQAITGTTTFTDVNTTYSAVEYNTAGTISGAPAIVIDSGYVGATNQAKGHDTMVLSLRYPITLDRLGVQRALGTLSLNATGIGGTSACRGTIKWTEVR